MSLDVRKIPVFTKYTEGTLQRPQFLEYFNFVSTGAAGSKLSKGIRGLSVIL